MIARLIGIIGSTHGVRFSARPPRSTTRRIASGPRPSNRPRFVTPASASRTLLQEVGRVQISAERIAQLVEPVERGEAAARDAAAVAVAAAAPGSDVAGGLVPWPNAIASKTLACWRRDGGARRRRRGDAIRWPPSRARNRVARRRPDSEGGPGRPTSPGCGLGRHGDDDADRELPFEHGQRLRLPGLRQVGRPAGRRSR